jgi:hypothetical protein
MPICQYELVAYTGTYTAAYSCTAASSLVPQPVHIYSRHIYSWQLSSATAYVSISWSPTPSHTQQPTHIVHQRTHTNTHTHTHTHIHTHTHRAALYISRSNAGTHTRTTQVHIHTDTHKTGTHIHRRCYLSLHLCISLHTQTLIYISSPLYLSIHTYTHKTGTHIHRAIDIQQRPSLTARSKATGSYSYRLILVHRYMYMCTCVPCGLDY